MFYCRTCARENEWPNYGYLPRSRGNCEMCGEYDGCFDVPSSQLPMPKDTSEQDAINSIKATITERAAR